MSRCLYIVVITIDSQIDRPYGDAENASDLHRALNLCCMRFRLSVDGVSRAGVTLFMFVDFI